LKVILEVQDNNYYSRLCLSISDFHPDTWNPAWSVSTILTGLLSFMLETTPTAGSMESTDIAVNF
jgi:ubiquitin-conjugating enzyme E2 J2